MTLENKISELIKSKVAELGRDDLFRKPCTGFAAADNPEFGKLKSLIGPWHRMPEDFLPGARSVISFYVPFTSEVAAGPGDGQEPSHRWGEAYEVINDCFAAIGDAVIELLEEEGFRGEKIPATHTYDPADLKCFWSHRSTAVIAGLGSFGANGMVITASGSAVRFCTIITDADLTPGKPYEGPSCMYLDDGSCGICLEICPVQALTAGRMDKFVCQDQLNKNQKLIGELSPFKESDVCGKCISICPFSYIEQY